MNRLGARGRATDEGTLLDPSDEARQIVERAKSLLVIKHRISDGEAHSRLEERARRENRALEVVAEETIEELSKTLPPVRSK